MRSMIAAGLLLASTTALAAPDPVQRMAERDLFQKVVEIPTVAGRGQMPKLTALLSGELKKAGITDIKVIPYADTQMLVARWHAAKPSGKKPILLMAHMDVVEAKASDWKYDPFIFREEGGYYLGRGASDNKAALTGIVLALQGLKRGGFQPTRDIILLFTGDEEVGGDGARLAATKYRALIDSEFALNGDAGGGSVFKDGRLEAFYMQVAEKTYADFTLTATNKGGHSSAPRPDNAIYQLATALKAVEYHRFEPMMNEVVKGDLEDIAASDKGAFGELIRKYLEDPSDRVIADLVEANMPGQTRTRCVATQLSGGHAPNALPQKAEANVNCRIFPGVSPAAIRDQLQKISGQDVTVSIEGNPAFSDASPVRADIRQAYARALAPRFKDAKVVPIMSAGATDGVFLRAAGIPVYGAGGLWGYSSESSNAHGLNERMLVEGFHDQIPFWQALLRDLAG